MQEYTDTLHTLGSTLKKAGFLSRAYSLNEEWRHAKDRLNVPPVQGNVPTKLIEPVPAASQPPTAARSILAGSMIPVGGFIVLLLLLVLFLVRRCACSKKKSKRK